MIDNKKRQEIIKELELLFKNSMNKCENLNIKDTTYYHNKEIAETESDTTSIVCFSGGFRFNKTLGDYRYINYEEELFKHFVSFKNDAKTRLKPIKIYFYKNYKYELNYSNIYNFSVLAKITYKT